MAFSGGNRLNWAPLAGAIEVQGRGLISPLGEIAAAHEAAKRELFADLVDGVGTEALRRLDLPTLLHAVGVNPPLSNGR